MGHEVGYTIRFDDCSDPQATRIKVIPARCLKLSSQAVPVFGSFQYLMCVCVSVPYRWHAGAGDDG